MTFSHHSILHTPTITVNYRTVYVTNSRRTHKIFNLFSIFNFNFNVNFSICNFFSIFCQFIALSHHSVLHTSTITYIIGSERRLR